MQTTNESFSLIELERRQQRVKQIDSLAALRAHTAQRHAYYSSNVPRLVGSLLKPGSRVLEVGCGLGDLLATVAPNNSVGTDELHALPTVSVICPCRNEKGNIRAAIDRTPVMGPDSELILVDGNSTDGTVEEIEAAMGEHKGPLRLRLIPQGDGKGKGDAVRKGFAATRNDFDLLFGAARLNLKSLTFPCGTEPALTETRKSAGSVTVGYY